MMEATTVPTVPDAPKIPWAVDDRPRGLAAATIVYSAGVRTATPVASHQMMGMTSLGSGRTV